MKIATIIARSLLGPARADLRRVRLEHVSALHSDAAATERPGA